MKEVKILTIKKLSEILKKKKLEKLNKKDFKTLIRFAEDEIEEWKLFISICKDFDKKNNLTANPK